jgi:nucleotide-binding universal stress UspA family protein
MAYRTILVSLNELDRVDVLLETATQLAEQDTAHIIGLYVIPAPAVFPPTGPYGMPAIFDSFTKYFEGQLPRVRAKFETSMMRSGGTWKWLEARSTVPAISDTVSEMGRSADLVVMSETDRKAEKGVELDVVENVVLSVGRPVLILPRQGDKPLNLSEVVCGYNGSREATRAVYDALPVLQRAENVQLVWVDPYLDPERAGVIPGADMAECLDRHGVRITAEAMPTNGINPAEALLTRARDLGAGMLVMGAYGHSRLREFVLGGATKEALTHLSVPLLLSH